MSQHHDEPQSPIKTPKQLILAVIFAFLVPIFAIALLVRNVGTNPRDGAGTNAMGEQAVAERLRPVGQVLIKLEGGPLKTGEQVFQAQCSACHAAGLLGAPKFGDAAAWGPRLGQGFAALVNSALKGKGNMGPQGGGDHSDLEIARAVAHMANAGGGKFEEPKAPEGAASAAN
ncbi:MAG: hypothetical protein QG612_1238 [Pseudomonadota bacterium]|nr:hypothetical protein [Pseudomonadota bacterium]